MATLRPTLAPNAGPVPSATPRPTIPPTQGMIEFFAARVTEDPDDGDAQLQLGLAVLQRIRETADPSLYPAAEAALQAARRLRPDDPLPLVGLGGVLLGKHEFADALQIGQAAEALDPSSSGAGGVVVDALIELGQYDEASAAVDRLVARSADLTSLARLSYARELQGDLPGALEAMRRAAAAPGLAPENTAFALAIAGQLEQQNGDAARPARPTRPPSSSSPTTRRRSRVSAGWPSRPATSTRRGAIRASRRDPAAPRIRHRARRDARGSRR